MSGLWGAFDYKITFRQYYKEYISSYPKSLRNNVFESDDLEVNFLTTFSKVMLAGADFRSPNNTINDTWWCQHHAVELLFCFLELVS